MLMDRDAGRWWNSPPEHIAGVKSWVRLPSAGSDPAAGWIALKQLTELVNATKDFYVWTENFHVCCRCGGECNRDWLPVAGCNCWRGRRKCRLHWSDGSSQAPQVEVLAQLDTTRKFPGDPETGDNSFWTQNQRSEMDGNASLDTGAARQESSALRVLKDLIRSRFLYIRHITDTGLLTSAFHNMRAECQTNPNSLRQTNVDEQLKHFWMTLGLLQTSFSLLVVSSASSSVP